MKRVLELMGDNSPLGLVVLHESGVIRHINDRMLSWAGKSREECLNVPFTTIFPDAVKSQCPCLLDCPADARPSARCVFDPQKPDGELLQVNAGGRKLTCLLCQPFEDRKDHSCDALLFYDADEVTGFKLGLALTIQRLEAMLTDQSRLMEKLEQVSNHLMRAEKMAGIGQLAAGVAHEINNPLGYVFSNLKTLAGYMQDMLKIIDAVDAVNGLEELRALKRTLDYDYIKGDVESLLNESEDGISRVKKIISALKDFSHIDEEGFRKACLHRAIETTLSVVNNEIKYKAEVVREYGELPPIECDISQLKQVIMNMLVNAAQAISGFGRITVRTGHDGDWVWFEVQDTGHGIDPAVKERIFKPFFTTKPLGQGTGLGLSLSYSIIQKHQGRIDVSSTPGEGSCFRVWLPVTHENLNEP